MSVTIRRATVADLDFIAELYAEDDVRTWLAAAGPYDREAVRAELERFEREPASGGLILIEADGERAGVSTWELVYERSRIARLGGLAIHPRFRGRRIADEAARLLQRLLILELGFHRLELEIYGFNERAQRHAERAGFVREGVKRQAYRRGDGWVDGVCYALIAEDLNSRPLRIEHVALWTTDLERLRAFYERWFGARAGARYENQSGFASYFLSFAYGARLELMTMTGRAAGSVAHVALSVGSEQEVDELTERMRKAGLEVADGPRRTGDGYYESVVLDPDGNRVELTV